MQRMKKVIIFICILLLSLTVIGCDNGSEVGDNNAYYDKVASTLKLTKTYSGKDFLEDGIGKATVDAYTDGDTTRFKTALGEVISVRYYEIDTPESTSNIQKWGKAASNFTKMRLSEATEIVLEATASVAKHDSYGTRYLAYVWYKTADHDFRCLNLEIVENGFSENEGINTSDYPYYSYFKKAQDSASKLKIRLWSDAVDPLYNTDPQLFTLKEFNNNPDLFYNSDTDTGAKVIFYATLTSLYVSQSGTYTFTASEYDEETGIVRTINLYAGYVSSAASDMKIGHKYKIQGNLAYYAGKFQISGVLYDTVFENLPGYTVAVQRNHYLMFNSDVKYISQYSQTLYGNLTITNIKEEEGSLVITGTACKATSTGFKADADTFTIKVKIPENYSGSLKVGDAVSLRGFQFEENSKIIDVLDFDDITIK